MCHVFVGNVIVFKLLEFKHELDFSKSYPSAILSASLKVATPTI